MNKFLSGFVLSVLAIIFFPLALLLLFAMPVLFVMASWENTRINEQTTGVIIDSHVTSGRKSSKGSEVTFQYVVEGITYQSEKWAAGPNFKSPHGYTFAEEHPVGTEVTVYYDRDDPAYALLIKAWPKWSVGFSLAVWGLLIGYYYKPGRPLTPRFILAHSLPRGALICGGLTLFFLPDHLDSSGLLLVVIGTLIISSVAAIRLVILSKMKRRTIFGKT